MNSPPRSFGSRVNLQENTARAIEKDATCCSQLDSELCALLVGRQFLPQGPDLAAEQRLRVVQLRLGRQGQSLCFGDRNEITQMS
jgi:hypothetical protein